MFEVHFWGMGRNEKLYFNDEQEALGVRAKKMGEGFHTSISFVSYVPPSLRKKAASQQAARTRRIREQVLRDLGMVKVRGALGGTYWE